MKSAADRAHAESLFVRQGKSLDEISALTGVSKGTLARWSAEGEWAKKRQEVRKESPTRALDRLKERRARLIEILSEDPAEDATAEDRLSKLQKIIETLESRDAIGPALDVMERFALYVAEHADHEHPDGAAEVVIIRKWTEKFLDQERLANG